MKDRIKNYILLIILSILTGASSGLFAIIYRKIILSMPLYNINKFQLVLIPALGGIVVASLIYNLEPKAKGHGIPEVMEAVVINKGKIKIKTILTKVLASAVSIGSGNSVGSTGPIVEMGAGVGSILGQIPNIPSRHLKTLVGCGAAAGIASLFNAPIAGVFFALEIILFEFTFSSFGLIVISSVMASVINLLLNGNQPFFSNFEYSMVHSTELIFYIVLGILAAGISRIFISALYKISELFENWDFSIYFKPVIGGLMVGGIGLGFPYIMGLGCSVIEKTLNNQFLLPTLTGLIILKVLATSITLGSGHSGGIFTPSLFIGAALGSSLGILLNNLYPAITASPGAYALVGMGAVIAGTMQAPITAIMIIMEITRNYQIILPLLISCVISTIISTIISKENIYTGKLIRRGINPDRREKINESKSIFVKDIMVHADNLDIVSAEDSISKVIKLMQSSRHTGFPVINKTGKLVGIITLNDIRDIDPENRLEKLVSQHMTKDLIVAYPDEFLTTALKKLTFHNIGRIPVVDKEEEDKLVGLISRSDVIKAYNQKVSAKE
ncbi:chloride channel protein [Sporohalobacter salinus]|uniref:chloride channel protein n=1 Tax=Sporohalobacter salinus TaxID=1494606 RepID=UPI001960B79C|nr:chloride channel protein [Sporohalobacter salinus]MBM7624175.1 CIC family chloride channel protein [Sporohalobacter salinus]